MKRVYLLATALVSIAALSEPSSTADEFSLVGTWRVLSFTARTIATNEIIPYPGGDNPNGYIQYSPGGHMVVFLQGGTPPHPSSPYTDAERAEIHKGIFGAYAGTYTVEGNKVTHHIVAAWRPEWIGGDQVRYTKIDGKKLTIEATPVSALTGERATAVLTFERVE